MTSGCAIRDKYVKMYQSIHLRMMTHFSSLGLNIALKLIDEEVIIDWEQQWKTTAFTYPSNTGFDWNQLYKEKYRGKCKRLDLAIYKDGALEGLIFGKITSGRLVIRIDYLQGSPLAKSELKGQITAIATTYATYVGLTVEAQHISIVNPVNSMVEEHYRKHGFEYGRYYGRFIKKTMYRPITEM